jgi:hypothetical protein
MDCRLLGPGMGALLLASLISSGCATPVTGGPTLAVETHILRVALPVDPHGVISLAAYEPLVGQIDIAPILSAEGVPPAPEQAPRTVQVMMSYGRFYVVADGFRAIWEITPQPGTRTGTYRPIALVPGPDQAPLKAVRLSRYGSSQSSCLRIDRAAGDPIFITSTGEVADACP